MTKCKGIPGCPDYDVCDNGTVKNKHTGRVLKTWSNGSDYQKVEIVGDKGKKREYVHILVAKAFLNGSGEVDHLNKKRTDNRASNLEYVTRSENEDRKKQTKEEKKEASEGLVDGGTGQGTIGVSGFRTIIGGKKKIKKGETDVTG